MNNHVKQLRMISSFLLRHKKGIQPSIFFYQNENHQDLYQPHLQGTTSDYQELNQPKVHLESINQPSVHQNLYQPNIHLERNKQRDYQEWYQPSVHQERYKPSVHQ
jgi:hypothetical protein